MLTNKTWAIASIYQSPKITDSNFTFSSGYNGKNWAVGDKWHYIKAYKAFKEMYPRISTGSPLDPWRVVRGDIDGTQKTYRFFFASNCCRNSNAADRELEPLDAELELGDPQVQQQVGSSFSQFDPIIIILLGLKYGIAYRCVGGIRLKNVIDWEKFFSLLKYPQLLDKSTIRVFMVSNPENQRPIPAC